MMPLVVMSLAVINTLQKCSSKKMISWAVKQLILHYAGEM